MKKDNVGIAFFFVVIAFVLTMSILMSIFLGINRYMLEKKSNIPMYVFCLPTADRASVEALANKLEQKNGVIKVTIIDKQQAFKEMVNKFSIDKSLFDKNPFPYSIELFFQPGYTNIKHFKEFRKNLSKNSIVSDIRYPEKILLDTQQVFSKMLVLSEVLFFILYAVEFVVFISIITVLYSHKKHDFNTLKFLGIRRLKILSMFLKRTLLPALSASAASVILIIAIYFLYDKYANIYYINKELFKSSLKMTFALNVVVGLIFTLFASFFVFLVNDEKV